MVKTRIEIFPDIEGHIDFFETLPEYDPQMYVHKKMNDQSGDILKRVFKRCSADSGSTGRLLHDALYAALSEYVSKEGVKTGFVMWPIRTAVSGKQMTPAGATEIMEVLGKEESISRIKKGIELLEAQQ